MEPIRLNKYLSEAGVCSRREADRLVEEGKVRLLSAQYGAPIDRLIEMIPNLIEEGKRYIKEKNAAGTTETAGDMA